MGLKIMAVGIILLALTALGMGVPPIVTGILLLIGGIGVVAGY